MQKKQNKPKKPEPAKRDLAATTWAVIRLLVVLGFGVAGLVLLGWVDITEQAQKIVGAFLLATAVVLMYAWFRYNKINV